MIKFSRQLCYNLHSKHDGRPSVIRQRAANLLKRGMRLRSAIDPTQLPLRMERGRGDALQPRTPSPLTLPSCPTSCREAGWYRENLSSLHDRDFLFNWSNNDGPYRN